MLGKSVVALLGVLTVFASGCTLKAPGYMPDYAVVDTLKRQQLAKIAVEPVEPRDPSAEVNAISLRGSSLVASSGSFAQYLEQALISDLTDANMLDQKSVIKLSTVLLKNDINVSGFLTGEGTIEAKFNVGREGRTIFNKTLWAETKFDSSFVGSVAIPKGQNEYPNLVRALLRKLYADNEFLQALKK